MHTLLLVLFILGLIGALISELWLVMRMLSVLTSWHPPAPRDVPRRDYDEDVRL